MSAARDEQGSPLEVDHVNSDKFNDTVWNLALLTRQQNRSEKRDLAGRFCLPYCFAPFIMPNGDYRAIFGYVRSRSDHRLVPLRFTTVGYMTDFLRYVQSVRSDDLDDSLRDIGVPAEVYALQGCSTHLSGGPDSMEGFRIATDVVKRLSNKPDSYFITWESPADFGTTGASHSQAE